MFSKNKTAIFSGLFLIAIGSQVINAGRIKAFPDLTDAPDPANSFRNDFFERGQILQETESRFLGKEPEINICVPITSAVEMFKPQNTNAGDQIGSESPDKCAPVYKLLETDG